MKGLRLMEENDERDCWVSSIAEYLDSLVWLIDVT